VPSAGASVAAEDDDESSPPPRAKPIPRLAAIDAAIARVEPRVVQLRRTIHANPELGEREHDTAALAAKELRELGLEVETGIAGTGVVAVLKGGKPGSVVAWRADMDALPITEATGLPFASTKRDTWEGREVGVMHACGHDMHTAIALGIARVLSDESVRAELPGTVVFLLQPAEEGLPDPGTHGAPRMIDEGALRDPSPRAIFGLHVDPNLQVGTAAAIPGGALAASDRFEITIRGKGSHGAYPHLGIDPIVIASHMVLALQTISARNIDPRDSVVVTVGQIAAGNRYNVIPETAEIIGTVRTHDERVQARVHERLEELAVGVAKAHEATADVKLSRGNPVTVNDPRLFGQMRPVLAEVLGEDNVIADRPHMGAEDFSYYAREIPGLYYFIGVGNRKKRIGAMTHTPQFVADEDAIAVGLRTGTALLWTWLQDAAE
jgi:amidohydrolase